MKSSLLRAALVLSAVGFSTACEPITDATPTVEPGTWIVDFYNDFNAGLVGGAADAATICAYKGDGVNNVVYLEMGGSAFASFRKQGASTFSLVKVDGRTVRFENQPGGYLEQKATTTLYRQINPSIYTVGANVTVSAGNEKAVNIIPKTDFVWAEHDPVAGRTKLTLLQKRTNRYVRIRTDYNGWENYTYIDSDGISRTTRREVIKTDLYQVDCGSEASGRVSAPTLVKDKKGLIIGKNAKAGDLI
jgi:hypothetical protein